MNSFVYRSMGTAASRKLGMVTTSSQPVSTETLREIWFSFVVTKEEREMGLTYNKAKRFIRLLCATLNVCHEV
jgi:hypothetical protein